MDFIAEMSVQNNAEMAELHGLPAIDPIELAAEKMLAQEPTEQLLGSNVTAGLDDIEDMDDPRPVTGDGDLVSDETVESDEDIAGVYEDE